MSDTIQTRGLGMHPCTCGHIWLAHDMMFGGDGHCRGPGWMEDFWGREKECRCQKYVPDESKPMRYDTQWGD